MISDHLTDHSDYFTAAHFGFYDLDNDTWWLNKPKRGERVATCPGKAVRHAVKRLQEGYSYITATPAYPMSRQTAAKMLANPDRYINPERDPKLLLY